MLDPDFKFQFAEADAQIFLDELMPTPDASDSWSIDEELIFPYARYKLDYSRDFQVEVTEAPEDRIA